MSVCFVAGAIVKTLQVSAFTLVWTHSVQKTDWQEDWRASPDGLLLTEARVKGSGAGIDPPYVLVGQSYGGLKASGIGREFSLEGMLESFTSIKQINVKLTQGL